MAKKYGEENIEPGDNAKYLEHEMKVLALGHVDIESDEAVDQRLAEYLELCIEDDRKPTVSGMALSLGISRFTLDDWRTGRRRGKTSDRAKVIEKYYNILQALYEDYVFDNKMNNISAIFIGKNHFGYTDKKDIVVTAQQKFDTPQLEASEIRNKYLESAGEIEAEGTEIQ